MKTEPILPLHMKPWLLQVGSITEQLKAKTKTTKLEVLKHDFESPDTWDLEILRLSPHEKTLHREIMMWDDKQPCWYARTILPNPVYQAEKKLFEQLSTTPLGELIHDHPDIQRTEINPYEIHPNMQEYHYLTQALINTPENTLWGRLSTFSIREQFDFYLLEIFLPGLLKYCL